MGGVAGVENTHLRIAVETSDVDIAIVEIAD